MAPQSQSRLSEEVGPPQLDCTANVRAGQALIARVIPRSRYWVAVWGGCWVVVVVILVDGGVGGGCGCAISVGFELVRRNWRIFVIEGFRWE